jgi:uncharacterized membrane protein
MDASQLVVGTQNNSPYGLGSSTSPLSKNLPGLTDPLQQSVSPSNRASDLSRSNLACGSGVSTVGAIVTALSISLLSVAFVAVQPAEASLKLCNRTNSWINTAIAHVIPGGWRSRGWWGMNPGECKTVYGGSAKNREFHVYVYSGDKEWDGDQGHCVSDRAFTIDITLTSPRCYNIKSFRKFKMGSEDDYNLNIR